MLYTTLFTVSKEAVMAKKNALNRRPNPRTVTTRKKGSRLNFPTLHHPVKGIRSTALVRVTTSKTKAVVKNAKRGKQT